MEASRYLSTDIARVLSGVFEDNARPVHIALPERWDFEPVFDLKETMRDYVVFIDLPGIDEDTLRFQCDGRKLSVHGTREFDHDKEDAEEFTRIERPYGSFCCTITFQHKVDSNTLTAKYRRGVLRVRVSRINEQEEEK